MIRKAPGRFSAWPALRWPQRTIKLLPATPGNRSGYSSSSLVPITFTASRSIASAAGKRPSTPSCSASARRPSSPPRFGCWAKLPAGTKEIPPNRPSTKSRCWRPAADWRNSESRRPPRAAAAHFAASQGEPARCRNLNNTPKPLPAFPQRRSSPSFLGCPAPAPRL